MNNRPSSAEENRRYMLLAVAITMLTAGLWVVLVSPIAVFMIPVAVIGGYGVLRQPYLVCLAFIIFSFFRVHEAIPALMPLHIPQGLALGALGSLGFNILLKRLEMFWRPEMGWFLIFAGLVGISVLMADNRPVAMKSFTGTYVKIVIMWFATVWLCRSERDLGRTVMAVVAAGALISCVAVSNKINGIGLVEGTRVTIARDLDSILGDPNDLALTLLFPLSFALAVAFGSRHWWGRLAAAVVTVLILWAVIATQSRGGLLGLVAVLGVFANFRIRNKFLLVAGGAFGAIALYFMAGVSDRQSGGAAEEGIDASAMGRVYAWQAAIGMALANPVTGVGLANFFWNYWLYTPHWDGKNHAVHSTWFGVLAETGFVGLILYVSLNVMAFKAAWSSLRLIREKQLESPTLKITGEALVAGLSGCVVSGTFLTQGFTWPFYVLFALSLALREVVHSQLEEGKPA